eukprot:CAMPEP_0119541978 /NCGR_PEP_ID=MMETSP1344-20130328/53304_1 /TAXON_ID=236787 /ORGANISM="Florenciella parvula, Strain CCMP2471" /LENGTH=66 /DNA_ID=CAMNT_0007586103 /DNA_START=29 /DNA_END=229 /DNA_ORIENTATION=+
MRSVEEFYENEEPGKGSELGKGNRNAMRQKHTSAAKGSIRQAEASMDLLRTAAWHEDDALCQRIKQ